MSCSRKQKRECSGSVVESLGRRFEPHLRHCVVYLSKNINHSLVLVQPRKTRPFITERLLMGCKESNQTKTNHGNKAVMLVRLEPAIPRSSQALYH